MINSAIIGASGYSGAEVFKILLGHPQTRVTAITSTSLQGQCISELYPNLKSLTDMAFTSYSPSLAKTNDIIFLALPHGQAMSLVPELAAAGSAKIIDLSGDFRLPASEYELWYDQAHASPELLASAVYGLSELNESAVTGAHLVSNPGCYPTGIVLGLAPLLTAKATGGPVVATCLSGISGAGRSPSDLTSFCRVENNVTAYKVAGVHQHIPEIEMSLTKLAQDSMSVVFTPLLGPFARGIFSNMAVPLRGGLDDKKIRDLYIDFYKEKPFIKILEKGVFPEVKSVSGSNYCHIGLEVDTRTNQVIVISAIDNLVKGAAGQAVQNMNLMFKIDETTGLTQVGLYP